MVVRVAWRRGWKAGERGGDVRLARASQRGRRAPLTARPRCGAQVMFKSTSSFNQDLDGWQVGQVTNMGVRRPHP